MKTPITTTIANSSISSTTVPADGSKKNIINNIKLQEENKELKSEIADLKLQLWNLQELLLQQQQQQQQRNTSTTVVVTRSGSGNGWQQEPLVLPLNTTNHPPNRISSQGSLYSFDESSMENANDSTSTEGPEPDLEVHASYAGLKHRDAKLSSTSITTTTAHKKAKSKQRSTLLEVKDDDDDDNDENHHDDEHEHDEELGLSLSSQNHQQQQKQQQKHTKQSHLHAPLVTVAEESKSLLPNNTNTSSTSNPKQSKQKQPKSLSRQASTVKTENTSTDNTASTSTTTTTFWQSCSDRAAWLIGLLILQSMSSFIIGRNEALLQHHLVIVRFLTMLVGAGGNAGNQASVGVIRGLAVGTIATKQEMKCYLKQELYMGCALSTLIGIAGCIRAAVFFTPIQETIAITASLVTIVFISVSLGAVLPLVMKFGNIDPAHSSTTIQVIMDILGVLITVSVSSIILDSKLVNAWFHGGED